MKKFLLAATALTAFVAGPAVAADLPVRYSPPPAPVVVSYYSWTGCYIGAHAGGAWSRAGYTTTMAPGTHLGAAANVLAVSAAGTGSGTGNGSFIGGGQVGCNYQIGSFVWGVEGDISGLSASANLHGTGILTTGDAFSIDNSSKNSWFGTVRGRAGVAFDRSLLYLTGGLAVTQLKYSQVYFDTLFNATGAVDASQTKTGWTIGAGWEYAFTNNWSVKAEYLYARFNGVDTSYVVTSTTGGTNVVSASVDHENKQIVRVGLNYKFGKAPAPVYTK